ncbi:unnamed protein product [[Candida] boidinii]|uniref:Unnamed protein product n=1 Tax=Candida boidinii TaxID=5477 RepID=A0ACB5TJ79_CANBO|nr:unnamed protein product [[Candida] boidinii]
MSQISISEYKLNSDNLEISFNSNSNSSSSSSSDIKSSKFHFIWLRDNCHCERCYMKVTEQRLINTFELSIDIIPKEIKINSINNELSIVWDKSFTPKSQQDTELDKDQDHLTIFKIDWLFNHSYYPHLNSNFKNLIQFDNGKLNRKFWDVESIESNIPTVQFQDVMSNDKSVGDWCSKIYKFGFCIVDNVPISPIDTEALINRISFIQPTHYGGFWDFTSDLKVHDAAYTNIAIPLHTDGTYFSEPSGLQLFHLLKHDGEGGDTTIADGFHVAHTLKKNFPEYYDILTKVKLSFHSAGEPGIFMEPNTSRSIIELNPLTNEVEMIRWNTSDRSSFMNFSNFSTSDNNDGGEILPLFYKAMFKFHEILESSKFEFWYKLKPGQCLIFDNWRVLHSRKTSFTGERRMCGAYINRDDFISRLKTLNIKRDDLLNSL